MGVASVYRPSILKWGQTAYSFAFLIAYLRPEASSQQAAAHAFRSQAQPPPQFPVFYNGAVVVVPLNSPTVPHNHPMPLPGHKGVVADTMVGVEGVVYVRWDPGAIVASGHYLLNEINLFDNDIDTPQLQQQPSPTDPGADGWHNGCDANPTRREQLLDLLALKGTYAMQRGGTYTHGWNHELGNLISMLRIAVATGRKLQLWTDEGPRLHRNHHMDQEYDEMLGSWQGFVDFNTSFFIINQTMLGLTSRLNSTNSNSNANYDTNEHNAEERKTAFAASSPATSPAPALAPASRPAPVPPPPPPPPLTLSSSLPPCLFLSDVVVFVDPLSVAENSKQWCNDRFGKMKNCRLWAVHHTHTHAHNHSRSQRHTPINKHTPTSTSDVPAPAPPQSPSPPLASPSLSSSLSSSSPPSLSSDIEYVEIDDKTDPRDFSNITHLIQEAGRETMQRKAAFVRELGKSREGQPLTQGLELTYKQDTANIRGVHLPFEVHVHVNPAPHVLEIAHTVYKDLLITASKVTEDHDAGAADESARNDDSTGDQERGSNATRNSNGVVCFIHSRRGDKLLPGYPDRDKTVEATTPEAVVKVVNAARPRCDVAYLATNEWDLTFYADSTALQQSPVHFQQFHDFSITREMMLRCQQVTWPRKLGHLNNHQTLGPRGYRRNKAVNTNAAPPADPRASWAREKQNRIANIISLTSTFISKTQSSPAFLSTLSLLPVSSPPPPSPPRASLRLSAVEMLNAGLKEAADEYSSAFASQRLDPSAADLTCKRCESVVLYGVEQALALFVNANHRLHTANTKTNAPSLQIDLKKNKKNQKDKKDKKNKKNKKNKNENKAALAAVGKARNQGNGPNESDKSALSNNSSSTAQDDVSLKERSNNHHQYMKQCIKVPSSTERAAIAIAAGGINGFQRAALFNTCKPDAAALRHSTDIVYAPKHGFAYYDNVKAGSSTIRQKLQRGIQANWYVHSADKMKQMVDAGSNTDDDKAKAKAKAKARTKSNAFQFPLGVADPNAFVFSFVRDPVTKFESGCRQAWFQKPDLQRMYGSASKMLDAQLALPPGKWLNEHLQPSTWRLTGWTGGGQQGNSGNANIQQRENDKAYSRVLGPTVKLDYIGALEAFDADWPAVVGHMTNLTADQAHKLIRLSTRKNARPGARSGRQSGSNGDGDGGGSVDGGVGGDGGGNSINVDGDGAVNSSMSSKEKLTRHAVLKMCRSKQYRDEWRCLGYPSPCSVYTMPICEPSPFNELERANKFRGL